MSDPFAFFNGGIDRAAVYRADPKRVEDLLKSGAARFLPVWSEREILRQDGDTVALGFLTSADAAEMDFARSPPVFLGLMNDVPWFTLALGAGDPADFGDFRRLTGAMTRLPPAEATLVAYGRAMVIWHMNHRHCGRCGAPAAVTEAGHSRTCTNEACKHRSFPRTDPAVITLIEHPDGAHCLMGRQPSWPAHFFSIIAGFVEPGETLEATVIREAREETGVAITDVRYMASQPWPFPSSIMLGFRARAVTTEIRRDDHELEECRWFSRAELAEMYAKNPMPVVSIAQWLINQWRNEK
jgi:NAD+ diphosphatase